MYDEIQKKFKTFVSPSFQVQISIQEDIHSLAMTWDESDHIFSLWWGLADANQESTAYSMFHEASINKEHFRAT